MVHVIDALFMACMWGLCCNVQALTRHMLDACTAGLAHKSSTHACAEQAGSLEHRHTQAGECCCVAHCSGCSRTVNVQQYRAWHCRAGMHPSCKPPSQCLTAII